MKAKITINGLIDAGVRKKTFEAAIACYGATLMFFRHSNKLWAIVESVKRELSQEIIRLLFEEGRGNV